MFSFPIGVMVDSFRLPLMQAIDKAAEVGAQGIQLYATQGELAPENLNAQITAAVRRRVRDAGLQVSAVCGDFGGHGFSIEKDNALRIERSRRVMDFARELGTQVVTTHIGVVPDDETHPRWQVLCDACANLSRVAEEAGGYFAAETGPEDCRLLKKFLDALPGRGMRVNFDPANLVMVVGDDPVQGVKTLGDAIVHTHAKDGVKLAPCDREMVYRFFAEGGIEDVRMGDYFTETALGKGGVDFPAWLNALEQVGYRGFITIEREVGPDPEGDIRQAVGFLKNIMG